MIKSLFLENLRWSMTLERLESLFLKDLFFFKHGGLKISYIFYFFIVFRMKIKFKNFQFIQRFTDSVHGAVKF